MSLLWDYYNNLVRSASSPLSILSPVIPVLSAAVTSTSRYSPETQVQLSGSSINTNSDLTTSISKVATGFQTASMSSLLIAAAIGYIVFKKF